MKITVEELEEMEACEDGIDTFKEAHPSGEASLLQALDSNGVDDMLWYLDCTQKLTDRQHAELDEWIRHQALNVAHLIESDEKELIVHFLKTGEDREAAREAAKAAREAAEAGEAAAWAAWAAEAAGAAAWAAGAVAWTVRAAAAREAAWAAGEAAREEQTRSLRELLERWEQNDIN